MWQPNVHVRYITGSQVFINDKLVPATLKLENGKITEILDGVHQYNAASLRNNEKVLDAGDLVVMPGLVDSHVHVNEPGRTEWEGFESATKAAAAGGITTLIDMPLNSIPSTVTLPNLEIKLKAAQRKCKIDVGFWGGVVPGNTDQLKPMIERGVIGFKCFLIHSGVDDFPSVTEEDVDKALNELQGTGKVLAFHAEVDCGGENNWNKSDPAAYNTFLKTRPSEMETEAIQMIDKMCRKYKNVRCHIVHLSSGNSLPIISKLKDDGYPITVETCPHYLTLTAEEILNKQTQFKCCPPIREASNQNLLWEALKSGLIDMIVSDHSPCTPDLKKPGQKSFQEAWGGISSVQFGLPIIWSEASTRGFELKDLYKWMCQNPAKLAGIDKEKSKLQVGYKADLVIWDPEEEIEIFEESIHHKNKITPYTGRKLKGKVHWTIVAGRVIYEEGTFTSEGGNLLVQSKSMNKIGKSTRLPTDNPTLYPVLSSKRA